MHKNAFSPKTAIATCPAKREARSGVKRLLFPLLFGLLLTACGGASTLSYTVTFPRTEDPERMAALSLATRHVVERRLARLEGFLIDYDVDYDKERREGLIEVEIDGSKAAKALNEEILAPFTFEMRLNVKEKQEGDIEVEGGHFYRETGIAKEDIDWVLGETVEGPLNQGKVIIGFTEEGAKKMKTLFAENIGSAIGLFVRGQLTARVQANDADFDRTFVIEGLPSGDIAKVFADDMNVGIHMVFTPKK